MKKYLLLLSCMLSCNVFALQPKAYYEAGNIRNNAVEAFVLKVCHIVSKGDTALYCATLKSKNDSNCNNFKNKYLKDICINDLKLLKGT